MNRAFEGPGRFDLETGNGFTGLSCNLRGLIGQKIIGNESKGAGRCEVRVSESWRRGRRSQQGNAVKSARVWPDGIGRTCDRTERSDGTVEVDPAGLRKVCLILNLIAMADRGGPTEIDRVAGPSDALNRRYRRGNNEVPADDVQKGQFNGEVDYYSGRTESVLNPWGVNKGRLTLPISVIPPGS